MTSGQTAATILLLAVTIAGAAALLVQCRRGGRTSRLPRMRPTPADAFVLLAPSVLLLIGLPVMFNSIATNAGLAPPPDAPEWQTRVFGFGAAFAAQVTFVLAMLLLTVFAAPTVRFHTGTGAPRPAGWGATATGASCFAIAFAASLAVKSAATAFNIELPPQDTVVSVAANSGEPLFLAAAFLSLVVGAPLAEELLFRGLLYPVLRAAIGATGGAIVTGLLFGAVHFNAAAFIPLSLMGAQLCAAYERTGDLRVPVGAHALFNFLSLAVTILTPKTQ